MKKQITYLLFNLLFVFTIHAQSVEWVNHFAGAGEDVILSIDTDNNGNTYSTGYYTLSTDFDGIMLENNISSFDAFVTKTDVNGNIIWAKRISQSDTANPNPSLSVISNAIAVDADGNVIIAGFFDFGDIDADPGPGVHILSATNAYEMFIIKLDADGDFIWATSFGASTDAFENIYGIDVDANGDIYAAGFFQDNISIDHAAGTTGITSYGGQDILVIKHTSDGAFSWMKHMGGPDSDLPLDMDVSDSGDVYVTGDYNDTAIFYEPTFNPFNSPPITLTTTDNGNRAFFALKLDTSGNYQNVVKVGESSLNGNAHSIAIDTNGFAYVTGVYGGVLTSNEDSEDPIILDSDENNEGFIAKIDFVNDLVVWNKEIDGGTESVFGYAVDTDSNNDIYLTGYYGSSITVGEYTLTKQTSYAQENYLIKMNTVGDFLGAYQFGGANFVDTQTLVVDTNDNIIIGGSFRQTVDVSPFSSEDLEITSSGFRDVYIISVNINNLLSTNDLKFSNNLSIYPNPAEDVVYITSDQQQLNGLKYTLFDVNGKSVLTGELGINNQININHLKSGFYFLTLNQSSKTFKLLKK